MHEIEYYFYVDWHLLYDIANNSIYDQ
jgi:hypothetical protein